MKTILKNDRFKRSRGGYSRLLIISCQKCGEHVCFYQKDGSGALLRMYIDRIYNSRVPTKGKGFSCSSGHLMGIRIVFEKENRPAFRLFVGSVMKKIVKAKKWR